MKKLTYNGFDPKRLGYKKFRDFLDEAESANVIKIDRDRQGDLGISLLDDKIQSYETPAIRRDLWKAAIDWSRGMRRFYDKETARVVTVPEPPAPLEPIDIAALRERIATSADQFIEIEPIGVATQLEWMHAFVSQLPDIPLRTTLGASFASDKPIKTFVAILRDHPTFRREWNSFLKFNVRVFLENWRKEAGLTDTLRIERSDAQQGLNTTEAQPAPAARGRYLGPSTPGTGASTVAAGQSLQHSFPWTGQSSHEIASLYSGSGQLHGELNRPASGTQLRKSLHAAIDRMPLEELRKLTLPAGYLFED
jgi:hypothetical protein